MTRKSIFALWGSSKKVINVQDPVHHITEQPGTGISAKNNIDMNIFTYLNL